MKDKFNNQVGAQIRQKKGIPIKFIPMAALAIIVLSLAIPTQIFARNFNYQAVLGESLFGIYPPWSIIIWADKWYGQYPDQVMQAGSYGLVVAAIGLVLLFVLQMILRNSTKANKYLHGSARWANKKDIEKAGLFPTKNKFTGKPRPSQKKNSVYVGAWQDRSGKTHYLKHSGSEHVLCYAPTRSGKGVGLVVPTCLSWGGSMVITDLKGELWELTAGWRKNHAKNTVIRFEPATSAGGRGARWNPLAEVGLGTESEVGDVQNLATLIVDPDGKGLNTHWQKTSQSLLVGVILHVMYKARNGEGESTLPAVDAALSDPGRHISELWREMVSYEHTDNGNHPVVGAAARDMIDRPDEEMGSVLSTAKSYLSLFRDPVVAENVSCSDFNIKDLMNHDSPMSLYIITQPSDKNRMKPLLRIMLNMIVRVLAADMKFESGRSVKNYKHQLLMMLDEFPSMGKLEIFQESLAFLAGYGIRCYLICQDINQLKSEESGYGRNEQITSNCHVQNAFPPNRLETAEHLSRLTGETTVIKERVSVSGKRTSALLGSVSRNLEEVKRNLMTPDECLRMPPALKNEAGDIIQAGDMVVYVAGFPAIYGQQPLYFKDPVFQARAEVAAPEFSDRPRANTPASRVEAVAI